MNGREEAKAKIENKINNIIQGKSPLYASYVAACFSEGQQPTTVKAYLGFALAFMSYLKNDCTEESVKEIKPMDISRYLNYIRTRKKNGERSSKSTSNLATIFSGLKSFFNFLTINKIIEENPMASMKRPKVTDEKPQDHLTIEEMRMVMGTVSSGTEFAGRAKAHEDKFRTRDEAIIRTFLELGLRCNALINLNVDDIDIANGIITYKDKGEKEFERIMSEKLKSTLMVWLLTRSELLYGTDGKMTDALFVSERKTRCSYGTILRIIKKYTRATTGNAMTVHKMRHSAITAVYELNGKDIMHASKFAGHTNVITTQRYINTDYSKKDREISVKLGAMI